MQNTIGIAPNIVRAIMRSCMNSGSKLMNCVGEKNMVRYIAPTKAIKCSHVEQLCTAVPVDLINLPFLVSKEIACLRLTIYIMAIKEAILTNIASLVLGINPAISQPIINPKGNIIFQKLSLLSRLVKNCFIAFICFIPFKLSYQKEGFKQRESVKIIENNHVD